MSALAVLALLAGPSLAATREVKKSFPAQAIKTVKVTNLAGEMRVEGTGGADVEIAATIQAEGSESEAQRLIDSLQLGFEERGDRLSVTARYPVDEHDRFRYPGRDDRGSWFGLNRSTVEYQGRKVTVTSGRSGAVTLWVDFVVRVPKGVSVEARNCVGRLTAKDVDGALVLDSSSGDIRAAGGSGHIRADAGSGDVSLHDRVGDAEIATGSGDVTVEKVTGATSVETGSGDVRLRDVSGKSVNTSTGSGTVTLERVSGSLNAETGSGDIRASDLAKAEALHAETGSGDVTLQGDLSDVKKMDVSTGSGDVVVKLSKSFPMRLRATTSSGDIDVHLPSLKTLLKREHELVAEVSGGGPELAIDTGSGSVRIESPLVAVTGR